MTSSNRLPRRMGMARYDYRMPTEDMRGIIWLTEKFPFLGNESRGFGCMYYHTDRRICGEWYFGMWMDSVACIIREVVVDDGKA